MVLKGLSIALLIFILSTFPVKAAAEATGDIAKQLICQCGCTLVLSNCAHAECGARDAMTSLIEQKLSEGQSEEQIIQSFAAQYGEQVLATPTKRGFNLTAWLTPFAAILAGGGVIYIAMRKWVKRGRHYQSGVMAEAKENDEEYRFRLAKELKDFTDRSFR